MSEWWYNDKKTKILLLVKPLKMAWGNMEQTTNFMVSISEQSFEGIRKNGAFYVDKTDSCDIFEFCIHKDWNKTDYFRCI